MFCAGSRTRGGNEEKDRSRNEDGTETGSEEEKREEGPLGQSKGTADPRGLRVRVRTGKGPGLAMPTRDPLGYPSQTREVFTSRWLKRYDIYNVFGIWDRARSCPIGHGLAY